MQPGKARVVDPPMVGLVGIGLAVYGLSRWYIPTRLRRRATVAKICIIFDGPPSHDAGRFVEVENEAGKSIRVGNWRERDDELWSLDIEVGDMETFIDEHGVCVARDKHQERADVLRKMLDTALQALELLDSLGKDVIVPVSLKVGLAVRNIAGVTFNKLTKALAVIDEG